MFEKSQKPQLNDGRYLESVREEPFVPHGNDTILRCVAELVRLGKRYESGLKVDGSAFSVLGEEILYHIADNIEVNLFENRAFLKIDLGSLSQESAERLSKGDLSAADETLG